MKCKFCNNEMEKIGNKVQGYIEDTDFDVYQCNECNLQQVKIENTYEELYKDIYEKIYKNSNILPGYSRYYKYSQEILQSKNPIEYLTNVEDVYNSVYNCIKEYKNKVQNPKILEIGSGLGYFTYGMKKAGFDIAGMEISNDAVKKAIKNYGNNYICADLFEYSQENKEKYDVVVMTEVIEHISEPEKFLKVIRTILKTGGILIVTTPNKGAYPENFVWHSDLPPIHLWWFSRKSLKKLMEITGYRSIGFYDIFKLENADKVFYNPNEYGNNSEYIFKQSGEVNKNCLEDKNSLKYKIKSKIKNRELLHLIRRFYWLLSSKKKIESKEPNIICAIFEK
ncbi:class I SAM-dependent methyltransferase [Fusobacterium varium]|uniref:class I SAM-dependent methyltransferase n=1 Tax=Fusobacterium varium TaxID=856 RepID=UPI002431A070|nr:class I SAM-dependent methyltransferase [Fusobacterium varium]MCF0170579.1 class I SAM-dependent methyltransferase [Fusobacterium varium]